MAKAKHTSCKQYLGFARVSSTEQEREGYSLKVQVEKIHAYATKLGGAVPENYC